ncbi:MAG: hypothetical protein COA49_06560 [Bacteroidetes bacterium]|nr:MAG: hypothetical protein COA49_06560 [Bacteroidota bacterium]
MNGFFIGQIIQTAQPYNYINNFMNCDGQLLNISNYTALFSVLGTTYGGNGMTTFALPDLRGKVAVGAGNGPGLSNYNVGETGGVE